MEPLEPRRAGGADARRTSTWSCTTTAWSRSPTTSRPIWSPSRSRPTRRAAPTRSPTSTAAAACRSSWAAFQPDLRARGMRRARRLACSSATPRACGRRWSRTRAAADCSRRYQAAAGEPQTGVITRRDIYEGKGYLPISLLQFTRGCRFVCEFCAVTNYFDRKHYLRAIDETLQEVGGPRAHRLLFFVDDNIASNREALKELCRALIPMRVNWVSQASLDITSDREIMQLMVDAGCLGHIMGFESITRASLKEARKAPNMPQVRPVRHADPHPARLRPADLGRVHARLRPRHARTRCGRRWTSRSRTTSPSRPSTS